MTDNKTGAIEKSIETISKILMYVCMGALFVMMLWSVADVAGRYLFNSPIVGTIEVLEILLPIIGLLGMAYTQRVKGHIRVEVFYSRFAPRPQAIIGILITLWSIILFTLIVWRGLLVVMLYKQQETVITNIQVPLFIVQFLVPLGSLAMCLVLIVDLYHLIIDMRKAD